MRIKVYFYEDGSAASKRLFMDYEVAKLPKELQELNSCDNGDTFTLVTKDDVEVLVRVFKVKHIFDHNLKELHVGPADLHFSKFNK